VTYLRILIIGAGGVGGEAAKRLSERGHSVTVVDKDEERILRLSNEADIEGIVRDATDPSLYDEVDLSSYDVVVAATDRDEVNLFVAALAKFYNVNRIIVRIRKPATARLLNMLGINFIVSEHQIAASIIYSIIEGYYRITELVTSLTGDFILVSGLIRSTSPLRGKRLSNIISDLASKGAKVLGVYFNGRFLDPDDVGTLEEGMLLIMLVHKDFVDKVSQLF
jgi:trk system potassium uptake protein TrkA